MAIKFGTDILLLTPPKTGSTWLRSSLRAVSENTQIIGAIHNGGHGDLSYYGSDYSTIACVVRKPSSWLSSYFYYREKGQSWENKWALDRLCGMQAHGDYSTFVDLYLTYCPGYVSNMFRNYTHLGTKKRAHILYQENLLEDYMQFLSETGISYNADVLKRTKSENVGAYPSEMGSFLTEIDKCEEWALNEYGYSTF